MHSRNMEAPVSRLYSGVVWVAAVLVASLLISCTLIPSTQQGSVESNVPNVIAVCSAGIDYKEQSGLSVSAALDSEYKKGGIEAAIAYIRSVRPGTDFTGSPENFKTYQKCVDKRLAELKQREDNEEMRCGPRGCLDIHRVADFTGSGCNADGTKRDRAVFTDKITLTKDSDYYKANAVRERGQKYTLFAITSHGAQELTTIEPDDENRSLQILNWNVPIENHSVRLRWEIINTQFPEPGIAFAGAGYVVRNITVETKVPDGVVITSKRFREPKDKIDKCSSDGKTCRNLYTTEPLEMVWTWTIWDKCK